MKKESKKMFSGKFRFILIGIILPSLFALILTISKISTAASEEKEVQNSLFAGGVDPALPLQIDVREGTPRGLGSLQLTAVQLKAINSLKGLLNNNLVIRYNGLTATPMNLSNSTGYLTGPNGGAPEQIARNFIRQWQEIFRFNENDLSNLKLASRATTQEGTTVLLFQQQANNLPVYHGEVLVNVAKSGQIINVGGDSFPRLNISNAASISAAQAVSNAANALNITNFVPTSLGTAQILTTYGDLPPEYVTGTAFARSVFSEDIKVQTIVFPLGDTGRIAYKFNLVTPQYRNIMWQNVVDAETGAILRRISLTSFQSGGGNSIPRLGTFRPDVQNMVENHGNTNGAKGRVFDTMPVTMSGVPLSTDAAGTNSTRAVRTGTYPSYMVSRPNYNSETLITNHFRYSLYEARNENPLPFLDPLQPQAPIALTPTIFGQVTRNFPDALYPSPSSPFGWFYLPTGNSGQMITTGETDHGTTQTIGYTMASEAQTRNLAINSPNGNGTQPFSADLTALGSTKTLADGRSLSSVYQSRYTEGNNVAVSDDHANDNDGTKGIKGYSANRQYNAAYYDYYGEYEFGGIDASGGGTGSTTPVMYPDSANPDVYPDTVSLFNLNNVEHDYLYSIGFTEPFWNFQFDNFGKGGAGNDAIIAEVQDGSGTDNANMSTPAEGSSPRMQMYLFTDSGFRRSDGDLDWDVVAHEHYHGVSNRSAAKGGDSCLGTPLVGESGGMGEGWSDTIASSMSDDDGEGEYVTGYGDKAIRRLPYTNYRYSYGSINDVTLNVRRLGNTAAVADANPGGIPYEVHDIGEVWAATLWDVRELMIMKDPNGVFFDGNRRLGTGSSFYVGNRQVQSVDLNHPIDYRAALFADSTTTITGNITGQSATINAANHIVRPGLLAAENATHPNRNGVLATAVSNGARLADKTVLRGLQFAPCNPTFVDMRDSMLAADREMTGGENIAIMWRAFASHGVGVNATSTGKTNGIGQQGSAAVIVEDFTVPTQVSACEMSGPLAAPTFSLSNSAGNSVNVTITAENGAANYVVQRATDPNGPFTTIATVTGTTYTDNDGGNGLVLGKTYYYQVHAGRDAYCISTANTQSITITVGTALSPAPIFAGIGQVADPRTGVTLNLSWSPATSANQSANIVYDIYRVLNVPNDADMVAPTFTPNSGNPLITVTGTSYTDTGLTLGQQYYYIVQARDTNNGKIDTLNVGNQITKLNAPSTNAIGSTTPFALETFDIPQTTPPTLYARFTPTLTESGNTPNHSLAAFQRATNDLNGSPTDPLSIADASSAVTGVMFAPDFDPGNAGQGGPSDFTVSINPTNLTRASFLEFDHRFSTEATFDGGNIEISLGLPTVPVGSVPNNATTFDLNDYIVQNSYNGNLNGTLAGGAQGSPLQGRRSFTGTKSLSHVKVALGDFAPGGIKNTGGQMVYIVFRMTSDAGTFVDGWYIDNLVVNDYAATGIEADVQMRPNGDGAVDSDDIQQIRLFAVGTGLPYQSNEFQRADCSPRSTAGDGFVDGGDVQQARRYSVSTDSNQLAGGPAARPAPADFNLIEKAGSQPFDASEKALAAPAAFRIDNQNTSAGQTLTVPIRVDTVGNEAGYTFSIAYDATKLTNPSVTIGNGGGDVIFNAATPGQIGFSVTSFSGGTIAAGNNVILVNVTFTVAANAPAGTTAITFTDTPARRKASGADPNTPLAQPSYTGGAINIGAPTAATISICGQINAASLLYNALNRPSVTLTGQSGQSRTIYTLKSGNFCFDEVEAGRTYILTARSKGNTYAPQIVSATENLSGIVFTPIE